MRAVLCHAPCGPGELSLDEVPAPDLAAGRVRIRVAAAGVNFADTLIIAGTYQTKPAYPFSPGMEVAGTVVECAADVHRCRPGDRVLATLDYGGFAEEAVAAETDVFVLPDGMDFPTAAAFPVAYGTSHLALGLRAGLAPGEVLVVHGAAGGVGLTAVEIGKAMGATVIATAGGPEKLKIAAAHGADHLIDYRTEDIRTRVKALTNEVGADVVYDAVGGTAFEASLRSINWSGRILVIGFAGGDVPQIPANILLVKNISVIGLNWGSYRHRDPTRLVEAFRDLFAWYEAGRLRPLISATYPLEAVPQAFADLKARKATGKLVIRMAGD
ncbi:MAG: zinc-binding dehydrogenase [Alphaproteobacteria bacterium]|jgi:NADPH2:quinone reductase|nr:zinc-binding dehydrogenase [Alphaproteobacteria bacterium]